MPRPDVATHIAWPLLAASAACDALGIVLIDARLATADPSAPALERALHLVRSPAADLGLVLFLVAPVLFAAAASRLPMVVAWPAQVGLSLLLVTLAAAVVLDEAIGPVRAAGMVCIGAGVWTLRGSA